MCIRADKHASRDMYISVQLILYLTVYGGVHLRSKTSLFSLAGKRMQLERDGRTC